MTNSTEKLSGRERSILRRQQMSKTGSAGMKKSGQVKPRGRQSAVVINSNAGQVIQSNTAAENTTDNESNNINTQVLENGNFEYCCDDCKEKDLKETCSPCGQKQSSQDSDVKMDEICELVDSGTSNASTSVRAFCRDRRRQMSKTGKQALPGTVGREARRSRVNNNKNSMSGRDLAKINREERCTVGRGDKEACRPSGRIRPGSAPSKVELGTTLAGQSVSGTQVEQTEKITGNEVGGCRAITGTEYIGTEQFTQLCSTTPKANEPKVGKTQTTKGQTMTGTLVEATSEITGTESGSCKVITGNEYLGYDHYSNACDNTNAVSSHHKVMSTPSKKNLAITGADEARANSTTGSESGAGHAITGSDYSTAPFSRSNAGATKVDVNHTNKGSVISGGELSSPLGVTGDAQDSCERVTGTEYVSNERFVSNCGTQAPLTPSKVSVDNTQKGMAISGNMMDRDEKVTGNEPGTCQRLSGSQYDSSANRGVCDQRSDKVNQTHTITGNRVSGSEVSGSPKLTGDDYGMCLGVTGNEYVSKESFEQRCSFVPMAAKYKETVSHTWNDQQVSGVQLSQSEIVTGDEVGSCSLISGSSYRSREEMSKFCDTSAVAASEQKMRKTHTMQPISGNTPSEDKRFSGNFNKGFGQSISGTPYLQDHNKSEQFDVNFSVQSPARSAFENKSERVHDSVFGINSRITGAMSKSQGVMTGTPEFRHPLDEVQQQVVHSPTEPTKVVTGEGNETGTDVTGDNWSRSGQITGTEGMFSSNRNDTQKGNPNNDHKIGAHALRDKEVVTIEGPKITNGSGGGNDSDSGSSRVTLSGGARG
jgi:hypothetical protein